MQGLALSVQGNCHCEPLQNNGVRNLRTQEERQCKTLFRQPEKVFL
ncbi:MAG: hypothetical protein J6M43_04235 [Neisseriaceae bacterium]|nr:hypothetical protein [Neisseriaceae bacterium]